MKFEIVNNYNIYVGLNDKDKYEQIISTDNAEILIRNIVTEKVGGATFSKAEGYWEDENHNPTRENTIIVKIAYAEDDIVEEICGQINKALNQNCVMVEKIESKIAFV